MDFHVNKCGCVEESDDELFKRINQIIDLYKDKKGSLIQILHMVQGVYGYLPLKLQRLVAQKVGLPLSKVYGVVTFYSYFSTKPKGECLIKVCLGTACYINGGKQIVDKVREILGIDVGETTEDGRFTLEVTRCLGACGLSPVITINDKVYRQVECSDIEDILNEYIY